MSRGGGGGCTPWSVIGAWVWLLTSAAPTGAFVERQTLQPRAFVNKHHNRVYYDPDSAEAGFWNETYEQYEPQTFRVIERFARQAVVLDIGAWIGPTALFAAQVAEKVIALEPSPRAFGAFKANLAANREVQGRVVAINAAFDAKDGIAKMTDGGKSTDRIVSPKERGGRRGLRTTQTIDLGSSTSATVRRSTGGIQLSFNHPDLKLVEWKTSDVKTLSIASLRKSHPELDKVGFVKIDAEGYERVIVPELQAFFKERRPAVFISLHPMYILDEEVQSVVDTLKKTFPYLYESDMKTPFDTTRASYRYGDHGGADVVCTWTPL